MHKTRIIWCSVTYFCNLLCPYKVTFEFRCCCTITQISFVCRLSLLGGGGCVCAHSVCSWSGVNRPRLVCDETHGPVAGNVQSQRGSEVLLSTRHCRPHICPFYLFLPPHLYFYTPHCLPCKNMHPHYRVISGTAYMSAVMLARLTQLASLCCVAGLMFCSLISFSRIYWQMCDNNKTPL